MTNLKVAVNVSRLSVSGLISKARLVTQRITDNPSLFPNCAAINARVLQAIAGLEAAYAETVDGGKSKTALMHDKHRELVLLMRLLGDRVEEDADNDPAMVHLAGLDVKKKKTATSLEEMTITAGEQHGSVKLKVKAREKTFYKWQYCQGSTPEGPWTDGARSSASRALISGLAPGIYWFRVVFVEATGDYEQTPLSFAVN